jgi:hypothetical protein
MRYRDVDQGFCWAATSSRRALCVRGRSAPPLGSLRIRGGCCFTAPIQHNPKEAEALRLGEARMPLDRAYPAFQDRAAPHR